MGLTLKEKTREDIKAELHWTKKVNSISFYHNLMLAKNPRQSYADTARELLISKSLVSENCNIAKLLISRPELCILSRKRVLFIMRNK